MTDYPDRTTGRLLWVVVLLAVVAALLTRALAPALPGVWVGVDHIISALKLAAAFSSQLVAVCLSALVMALVVATVQRPIALALRAFAVGVGALVVLSVMLASATRLPQLSSMIVGLGAALLAGALAVFHTRLLGLRAAALVVAAMALAGVLRLVAIAASMVMLAQEGVGGWGTFSRVVATLSWLVLLLAVALALWWLLSQPGRQGARTRLDRVGTVVAVLVVATVLMLITQRGSLPEARGLSLFVARAGGHLIHHPAPYLPYLGGVFVQWLALATALATLLRAPRTLMMSAAVAAALTSACMLEMPLSAALLVVAALALMHHPAVDLRAESSLAEDGSSADAAAEP